MQTFHFGLSRWRNMPGKLHLVFPRWPGGIRPQLKYCFVCPRRGVLGLIFNGFVTLLWEIQIFRWSWGGGVGGNHPDPAIWGGLVSKKFFSALQASVWPKNKGGGQPLPWIHHWAGLLKPLLHYSLFWVSIIWPHLCHFWKNVIFGKPFSHFLFMHLPYKAF